MSEISIAHRVPETANPVSFDWKRVRQKVGDLTRSYVLPANSEELYDLGHDGRGFDDFLFTHQFTEQTIQLQEFFNILADEIEKYIRQRLEANCTLPEVQDFFENVLTGDSFVPYDDFYTFSQTLREKYAQDKEPRLKVLRMSMNKTFKLGVYASIVWKLRNPSVIVSGKIDVTTFQILF